MAQTSSVLCLFDTLQKQHDKLQNNVCCCFYFHSHVMRSLPSLQEFKTAAESELDFFDMFFLHKQGICFGV